MKKLIALLLALTMVFGLIACGNKAPAPSAEAETPKETATTPAGKEIIPASEMEDPYKYFTQFDEPQELHIAMGVGADQLATLEGDDTIEDNFYTRWFLENYNIKIVFDWTSSNTDFEEKLSLAISSDTLPDAWICSSKLWRQAAKNGQLKDISDLYTDWCAPAIQALYETVGPKVLESCSYDGELSSITGLTVTTEGVSVCFINQDWLDQLGLEGPKNVEDVYEIAKAFKEAKLAGNATVPILGTPAGSQLYSTFNSGANITMGFDAIFGAYDSYPGLFYEGENGEIVYGTLTQETRNALEVLAQWYKEGLIDKEVGMRNDSWAVANANECGMWFGGWWNLGYGNASAFYNDPNANWKGYAIRNENDEWTTKIPEITAMNRLCISADASEEAAIAAFIVQGASYKGAMAKLGEETSESNGLIPLRLPIAAEDLVDRGREHVLAILNGEEPADLYQGHIIYDEIYRSAKYTEELIVDYVPGEGLDRDNFVISPDNTRWQALYAWVFGNEPYATVERAKEVKPVLTYMTPALEMYWDNLYSAETAMVLSIITGESDISAFDDFVNQWYAEGGQAILDEIAAEVA